MLGRFTLHKELLFVETKESKKYKEEQKSSK